MNFKIFSVVMLVASSCVNAADDCYYGFKASSAAQSCNLKSAQFEPGSTNYCRINADCHYYLTGGHEGWINNNGTWFVGDVRRLINNNGWLEVGNYSNNQAKEKFEADSSEE